MASIKEQKLKLYIKYLQQSDNVHFVIRGLSKEERKTETERIYNEHYSKLTECPKGYTLSRLEYLLQ